MLRTILFCTLVLLAILSVILLAVFSPINHKKVGKSPNEPFFALSLYIQQPQIRIPGSEPLLQSNRGALVFHRELTEGPENTSRVVGRAQGFIIPVEHFAHSGFNIIYLTFHTNEYSGSLSVEARKFSHGEGELAVVGGTGSFAFARGHAMFSQKDQENETYHMKLQLKYPNRSETIPG